jgi:hypothetical protein
MPTFDNLEYVLNFEKIDKPKTRANVCDWMVESFVEA